jgi:hypothetical protein
MQNAPRTAAPTCRPAPGVGLPVGLIGLLLVFSSNAFDPPPPGAINVLPVAPETVREVSHVPVRVRSDFAGALNGWSFGRRTPPARIEHRLGPGSDGGRGFLRFHDGGADAVAYLRMSNVHAGDQSHLYGGAIAFDLRVHAGGDWIDDRMPLLRFVGANGETMTFRHLVPPVRDAWTPVVADVLTGRWEINGRPATEGRMRAILADVAASELRIAQTRGGGEVTDLDSVEFVAAGGTAMTAR